MMFSEVYGTYFNTVAAILREAVQNEMTEKRMVDIINQKAFAESILSIIPALKNEEWLLLNRKGQTPIQKPPQMPLTLMQKRWLKSLLSDVRIALFSPDLLGLDDVAPLFNVNDFVYFDRYADGDPFTEDNYISNFQLILSAIKKRRKLKIKYRNRRGRQVSGTFIPHRIEYSDKDDKFRLISTVGSRHSIINLARIVQCEWLETYNANEVIEKLGQEAFVAFELTDERNALERVMLHFSDCRKNTQRLSDTQYHVMLWYDPQDETEILIRILSFGPMIQVIAPDSFVKLIKERIFRQQTLMPS